MLEFTGVYPPFFSKSCPLRCTALSSSANRPSYEYPMRTSPFYANCDSRIYQFICCTWSADQSNVTRKNSFSSHAACTRNKKYNYWPSRNIFKCPMSCNLYASPYVFNFKKGAVLFSHILKIIFLSRSLPIRENYCARLNKNYACTFHVK